jgi:hypothetical protein
MTTPPKKTLEEELAARELAAKLPPGNHGWDSAVAKANTANGFTPSAAAQRQ